MHAGIRRKLNGHIEFAASSQSGKFDALELVKQVIGMLDYPEQIAVLNDAVLDAVKAWIKGRIDRARPEQMAFPDFPHVPPLIRVGRKDAVAIEHATAKELEPHYQKLKARVKDLESSLDERLQQSVDDLRQQMVEALENLKAELEEFARLRKIVREADRRHPGITVEQALQRQPERKKATQ